MWISRDNKSKILNLFTIKPERCNGYWESYFGQNINIDCNLFPELTWEDEPIEVELTKKQYIKYKEIIDILDEMGYGNEIAEAIERCKENKEEDV